MSLEQFLSLYKEEESEEIENCLISGEKLDDSFVQLNCGHKFNYNPIFKDIYNHKIFYNCSERGGSRLNNMQIRCPYCRTIQNQLLPYKKDDCRHHGINFYFGNTSNRECFFSKSANLNLLNIDKEIKCNTLNKYSSNLFQLENKLNNIAKDKFKINFTSFRFCKNHCADLKDLILGKKTIRKQCQYIFIRGKNKGCLCNKNYNYNIESNDIDNGLCKLHSKKNMQNNDIVICKHILLRGKNKGKECGKKASLDSDYCKTHLK